MLARLGSQPVVSSTLTKWKGAVRYVAAGRGKTKKVVEKPPADMRELLALMNHALTSKAEVTADFSGSLATQVSPQPPQPGRSSPQALQRVTRP